MWPNAQIIFPALETRTINYEDLSPYGQQLHDKIYPHKKGRYSEKKLVTHLGTYIWIGRAKFWAFLCTDMQIL